MTYSSQPNMSMTPNSAAAEAAAAAAAAAAPPRPPATYVQPSAREARGQPERKADGAGDGWTRAGVGDGDAHPSTSALAAQVGQVGELVRQTAETQAAATTAQAAAMGELPSALVALSNAIVSCEAAVTPTQANMRSDAEKARYESQKSAAFAEQDAQKKSGYAFTLRRTRIMAALRAQRRRRRSCSRTSTASTSTKGCSGSRRCLRRWWSRWRTLTCA